MYPRLDQTLVLGVIARDWARDLSPRPTEDEVFIALVQAMWRGDLRVTPLEADPPETDRRIRLLNILRIHNNPGLLFVEHAEDAPPMITPLPDGGILASAAIVVVWPQDRVRQTAGVLQAACSALAGADLDDYAEEAVRVFLHNEPIRRKDFEAFCRWHNYGWPGFWFPTGARSPAHKAADRCGWWFQEQVRRHGDSKPHSKAQYLKIAREKFAALSERAFDNIWAQLAPASWKERGRPVGG